jgi:hypothetical protein
MPKQTIESLALAEIVKVSEAGQPIGGPEVKCMFNPYEYTLTKSNSFKEHDTANGRNSPKAELSKAGAQTLQLSLIFDTYATGADVSLMTDKLWTLMRVADDARPDKLPVDKDDKREVPLVAFHWGVFFFVSYITSMTQKFTLFTAKGVPVRAKVDITFTQYTDVEDRRAVSQNPTSGGGPIHRTWRVSAGDRLETIAYQVYRDRSRWRLIADYNRLNDPMVLHAGQMLILPYEHEAQ